MVLGGWCNKSPIWTQNWTPILSEKRGECCDSRVTSGSSWTPIFQKFYEILISLFDGKKGLKVFKVLQPGMEGSCQLGSSEVGGVGLSFGTSLQADLVPAL